MKRSLVYVFLVAVVRQKRSVFRSFSGHHTNEGRDRTNMIKIQRLRNKRYKAQINTVHNLSVYATLTPHFSVIMSGESTLNLTDMHVPSTTNTQYQRRSLSYGQTSVSGKLCKAVTCLYWPFYFVQWPTA